MAQARNSLPARSYRSSVARRGGLVAGLVSIGVAGALMAPANATPGPAVADSAEASLIGGTIFESVSLADPTTATVADAVGDSVADAKSVAARVAARRIDAAHDADAAEVVQAGLVRARTAKAQQIKAQLADAQRAKEKARAAQATRARVAAAGRANRGSAARTWPGQGNDSIERFRRCVVKRESEGQYGVVDPTGTWYGAYQFAIGTSNAAARRMGRSDLVGVPANRWSRAEQDAAFYVIYDRGNGASHWAGGRWAC